MLGESLPPDGSHTMLRRESTQRSFFDQTLYDRLIKPGHFLRRLNAAIDFGFVHRVCRGCYAREVGRPAASPVMLFKMVLLQFLFDISDRRIVEEVRYHMAFKWFCGLEADGEPPHPTTLTHFRARLGPELLPGFTTASSGSRESGASSRTGSRSWTRPTSRRA